MTALLSPSPQSQPILRSVVQCLTPPVAQRILSIEIDPALQTRAQEWAAKANEGTLTQAEREAYEELIDDADLLGIIKSLARQVLAE